MSGASSNGSDSDEDVALLTDSDEYEQIDSPYMYYDSDEELRPESIFESSENNSYLVSFTFNDGNVHFKKHASKLERRLEEIYRTSAFCDVTLKVGETTVGANKLILAANSDYFDAMFSSRSSWVEVSNKEVTLGAITPAGLKALLDFAYTGAFQINESVVRDILEAARYCLMPDVIDCCEIYLLEEADVNDDNYLDIFRIAMEFEFKEVALRCESFFKDNSFNIRLDNCLCFLQFAKFCSAAKILEKVIDFLLRDLNRVVESDILFKMLDLLDETDVQILLTSDRHGIYTDLLFVEVLVYWVRHDQENRLKYMPDIFSKIHLMVFDVDTLEQISNAPFIKDSLQCQAVVKDYLTTMITEAEEDGPFLLAVTDTDIELQSISSSVSATMEGILPALGCTGEKNNRFINHHSFASVDNTLYISGLYLQKHTGANLDETEDRVLSFHSYNTFHNKWTELAPLLCARRENYVIAFDGQIFSIAGSTLFDQKDLRRVDVYDPSNNRWRSTTPLPYPVGFPLAAASNGRLFVCIPKLFLRYDTASELWMNSAPVPWQDTCIYHDLRSCHGHLYLFGESAGCVPDSFMASLYDTETDQWTVLKNTCRLGIFPDGRFITHQNEVYIVTDEKARGNELDWTDVFVHVFDPLKTDIVGQHSYWSVGQKYLPSALISIPRWTIRMIQGTE